jgi:hypothetical protein
MMPKPLVAEGEVLQPNGEVLGERPLDPDELALQGPAVVTVSDDSDSSRVDSESAVPLSLSGGILTRALRLPCAVALSRQGPFPGRPHGRAPRSPMVGPFNPEQANQACRGNPQSPCQWHHASALLSQSGQVRSSNIPDLTWPDLPFKFAA